MKLVLLIVFLLASFSLESAEFVRAGRIMEPEELLFTHERWPNSDDSISGKNPHNFLFMKKAIGGGDFDFSTRIRFNKLKAQVLFGDNVIHFKKSLSIDGPAFGSQNFGPTNKWLEEKVFFNLQLTRQEGVLVCRINSKELFRRRTSEEIGLFTLCPWWGLEVSLQDLSFGGSASDAAMGLSSKTLFAAGKMGYPRHRIPSLCVTEAGTLIAAAEGRQGNDHSHNDILIRRSTDNGQSWQAIKVAAEAGDDVLIDTAPIVDRVNGRIWIFFVYFGNGYHNGAAKAGYTSPHRNRIVAIHSDDDGASWSAMIDLSKQIKLPQERYCIFGPGQGIQLQKKNKGRLILAMYGESKPFAVFSDDHGQSWKRGASCEIGKSEPQLLELESGDIMMNVRARGFRQVCISQDGGLTWGAPYADKNLPDPYCQGSIFRYSFATAGKPGIVLFSNPTSPHGRMRGVVRLSYDDGKTWPYHRLVYPYGFGYSCLTRLKDGRVGLVFEKDGQWDIDFTSFGLDWIRN